MSIYARIISVVKPISRIIANVGGTNKDITGVYTFVNGVRKQLWPSSNATLLKTITSAGSYSYTIPDAYKYVLVEIAGAAGQILNSNTQIQQRAGYGAIKRFIVSPSNRTLTGVIGVQPPKNAAGQYGGSGYQNGGDCIITLENTSGFVPNGGAGGGSTSVVIDGSTKTAGGGSGCGAFIAWMEITYGTPPLIRHVVLFQGGNGGGPNGGVAPVIPYPNPPADGRVISSFYNGVNATDATDGYNSGSGYVKIYGIY